jgi:hypothetical protein
MDATIEQSFIYDITQNQKIINDYIEASRPVYLTIRQIQELGLEPQDKIWEELAVE